jgi:hypothetical protein
MSRVLVSRSHCVYSLNAHLVFVTKYRKKVINAEVLAELKSILTRLLAANDCELAWQTGIPTPSEYAMVWDERRVRRGFHPSKISQTQF